MMRALIICNGESGVFIHSVTGWIKNHLNIPVYLFELNLNLCAPTEIGLAAEIYEGLPIGDNEAKNRELYLRALDEGVGGFRYCQ